MPPKLHHSLLAEAHARVQFMRLIAEHGFFPPVPPVAKKRTHIASWTVGETFQAAVAKAKQEFRAELLSVAPLCV